MSPGAAITAASIAPFFSAAMRDQSVAYGQERNVFRAQPEMLEHIDGAAVNRPAERAHTDFLPSNSET